MSVDNEQKVNERKRTAKEANLSDTDIDDTITEQDLELKEFECPRCDQAFDTTTSLYIHMRNQYTNPTICHICNKNLNALPNVLSHSYIHKNIKPYKCPKKTCKYTSRTRYNLKIHIASCAGIEKFRAHKRKKKKLKVTKIENDNIFTDCDIPQFAIDWTLNNMNIPPPMFNDFEFNNFMMNAPNPDIMDEIKDSGPVFDVERETTYLMVIHKDYIPKSIPQPLDIKQQTYNVQCQSMSSQASDDGEYINYKQYIDRLYCAPLIL